MDIRIFFYMKLLIIDYSVVLLLWTDLLKFNLIYGYVVIIYRIYVENFFFDFNKEKEEWVKCGKNIYGMIYDYDDILCIINMTGNMINKWLNLDWIFWYKINIMIIIFLIL